MRSESSIEIDRPIEDVFRCTNEHVADWSIVVVEDQPIDEGPPRVGSRFRTITEDHGQRLEFIGEVTRYDPPRHSAVHLTGEKFDIDAEYEFEDLSGRTRVTQVSQVQGKGLFKLFFTCFGWAMRRANCKATQREMESLKQFCESQA